MPTITSFQVPRALVGSFTLFAFVYYLSDFGAGLSPYVQMSITLTFATIVSQSYGRDRLSSAIVCANANRTVFRRLYAGLRLRDRIRRRDLGTHRHVHDAFRRTVFELGVSVVPQILLTVLLSVRGDVLPVLDDNR